MTSVVPQAWLYYLAHPWTPRWPRYVGMTTDLAVRARSHAKRSYSANPAIVAWKAELRLANLTPWLVPIALFDRETEARAAEWRLIQRWRRRGLCDLNSPRDGSALQWEAMCAARLARQGAA